MKKVKLFILKSCPYCIRALDYLDKLKKEHPEYQRIEIEKIDEGENPEIANQYDYWLVPTFYVDGAKLHEGVPTIEKVNQVLQSAME